MGLQRNVIIGKRVLCLVNLGSFQLLLSTRESCRALIRLIVCSDVNEDRGQHNRQIRWRASCSQIYLCFHLQTFLLINLRFPGFTTSISVHLQPI